MKRRALAAVLTILTASACGEATPPPPGSDRVVADVMAAAAADDPERPSAPTTTLAPGCEVVTERDEYGFDVDVVRCGAGTNPPAEHIQWLGSESAERAATLLRQAMLGGGCGTQVSYAELKELVAEAKPRYREPLLSAIADLEIAGAACNNDEAAWVAAMTRAVSSLEQFVSAVEQHTASGGGRGGG